jgi:hypothetical protein
MSANFASFPMNKTFNDSGSIVRSGFASRLKPNHFAAQQRQAYKIAARPQEGCARKMNSPFQRRANVVS